MVFDPHAAAPRPVATLVAALAAAERPLTTAELAELLATPIDPADLAAWTRLDPDQRTRTPIFRSDTVELLVLGWLPGQRSSVHGHGRSACAFRVVAGVASERRFARGAPPREAAFGPGAIARVVDGEVHDVRNAGDVPLVTLHAYSPPLDGGAMLDGTVPPRRPRVVVVGGGFCAAALVLAAERRGQLDEIELTVVDPGADVGRGVAYRAHPALRLNVPAGRMGATAEAPADFHAWLAEHGPVASPDAFVSRARFGDYVQARLAPLRDRFVHVRAAATAVQPDGAGWRVQLADGGHLVTEAVVLATGHAAPRLPCPAPRALVDEGRVLAEPWTPGALAGVGSAEAVLVLGTGLSALDVLVELREAGHRGPITLLSRRGKLPAPHHPTAVVPLPPPPLGEDLLSALRALRAAAREAWLAGHPWQAVIDGLRPHTSALWARLSPEDRRRFAVHLRPWWDLHRHRAPADLLDHVATLERVGRLRRHAGRLLALRDEGAVVAADVRLRGQSVTLTLPFDRVINATGPDTDLERSGGPLYAALVRAGVVTLDPHRLGLRTAEDGVALAADGSRSEGLYVLGGARRADQWENAAVPEMRQQAAALADQLASRVR